MTSNPHSKSSRRSPLLPILCLIATVLTPLGAAAQGVVVGWIETAGAGPANATNRAVASTVAISRNGSKVAYDDQAGLRACDKLTLLNPNTVVRIMLTNKERLRLDARTPELVLPCGQAGVTERLASFLRGLLVGAESKRHQSVTAATRSLARVKPLRIPALAPEQTLIAGGERSLYLAWKGGRGPYSVEVKGLAEGAAAVGAQGISTPSVRLPSTRFQTGQYALIVSDGSGRLLRDERLYVVPDSALPPMPHELQQAELPESARILYYADFLVGFEDGRFSLEALQWAASVSPQTPAAREWLSAWGDADQ